MSNGFEALSTVWGFFLNLIWKVDLAVSPSKLKYEITLIVQGKIFKNADTSQ